MGKGLPSAPQVRFLNLKICRGSTPYLFLILWKEDKQASADQNFQELADPADPSSSVVETPLEEEQIDYLQTGHLDLDLNNQPLQEGAEVSRTAVSDPDPVLDSSPTIDPKEEEHPAVAEPSAASVVPASSTDFAPVYVQYFGGGEEEDSVPPAPTSPFLEAEGAASGAWTSGHVQTGHSPSAPSRPPRVRGTRGGRQKQTRRLIKRWQSDFDLLAEFNFGTKPSSGCDTSNTRKLTQNLCGQFESFVSFWIIAQQTKF